MEDQPSASRESPLEAVQPILNATATHPLQDVGEPHKESVSGTEPAATAGDGGGGGVVSSQKKNWVKFDDDSGEVNETNNNQTTTTATVGTRSTSPSVATVTATAATSSLTAKAAAPTNQLSAQPQPPPRSTVTPTVRPDATAPAVLTTESTHVNLNASGKAQQQNPLQQQQQQQQYQKPKASNVLATSNSQQHQQSISAGAASAAAATTTAAAHNNNNNNGAAMRKTPTGSVTIPVETVPPMRTIELSTGRIREGFANGDVIVTLLPANTKWPWITPAIFRPELVPEELMAQGLTLTVEEYVNAMETLVNDYRFTFYNVCYKRVLVCWILFAFAVLLTLLFSGLQGVALFSLGVGWLFLNAAAIFLCMWVKLRLARGLEKCLARVNKQLVKHKILLILDDRGRISCHKVNLCFLYFDATQCVSFLNEFLEHTEQNGGEAIKAGWERKLDIDMNDIIIQGNNPVRLSRKQAVAQELFLSYLQRWGKDYLRRRLDWTVQEAGVHETPRHLQSSICPCQYEEEVLRNKIKTHLKSRQCCGMNCIGCWL